MGMLGELFPGAKLRDEGGEDGDGKVVRQHFEIDLDSGVVRLPPLTRSALKPAKGASDAASEQAGSE